MKPMFSKNGQMEPYRPHIAETRRRIVGADKFSEAHLALVNELLEQGVSAEGAYRMGLISTLSLMAGIEPTRDLFEQAIRASCAAEVAEVFEEFRKAGRA